METFLILFSKEYWILYYFKYDWLNVLYTITYCEYFIRKHLYAVFQIDETNIVK